MQVIGREGSCQPLVKNSNFLFDFFSNKNECFWTSLISRFQKNVILISVRCLEILKIAVWKMTSSMNTVLGLYVSQKYIYEPEIWHVRCPGMVLQHIVRFLFFIFENIAFLKSYIKFLFFLLFGGNNHFGNIRDSYLKELLILRLLVLFICILLQFSTFWWFFQTYFYQNGMTFDHLNWCYSKSFQENFPKLSVVT